MSGEKHVKEELKEEWSVIRINMEMYTVRTSMEIDIK